MTSVETHIPRLSWKVLLAYAIIYFVWGSTYLAIRVGVLEMPPLLMAAMRFLIAGALLYGWTAARGERQPSPRQWASIALLAFLIFAVDYGLVFWAEQRVPSGITAIMMATISAFMALAEIIFLRTQRLTPRLAVALLIGLGGVAVLVSWSLDLGGAPVDTLGAVALIVGAIAWAVAAVFARTQPLPDSKFLSSGAQMLVGGAMLAVASFSLGEFGRFHPAAVSPGAWFALGYLIVPGSIVAFTAYVWLLHHDSPTRVGTYAYVNPVVAVLLGYFMGGEALGTRTVLGALLVLVSVVMITLPITRQPTTQSRIAVSDERS
ncbi:MAG TPA: EamA family transporter [Gammaproteobacteria bacterium]|nr:EamA family transporter [Gammaproteobacteria bacterium]